MAEVNTPVRSKKSEVVIGKTNYIVTCTFNDKSRETADQKFLKLVTERVAKELKSPETSCFPQN